ncbi:E1 [Macaca mulatta papillomavirus 4]|uniref:Replication protein E1 n=1 Tax=Macaca mulatta papillomavirus 4 TaxID=2294152 RepID=A0A385AH05_9PAPI|nr:E1 [Macaca mulatta papillomavirus 4]AXN57296.1 E1 [Macaca mulatta papillomavirus 4]
MEDAKGTDNSLEGCSGWYIVSEAECQDSIDTLEPFEEAFECSTDSNISCLLDDFDETDEGNPLALYNKQITEECDRAIEHLKRKYLSPSPKQEKLPDLSPRLASVSISSEKNSKRRLLFEDSGISLAENEAEDNAEAQVASGNNSGVQELLQSSNQRATALYKFKDTFGVSFCELTRSFKSNKSCCPGWVVAVFYAAEELIEASKTQLQQHCEYLQVIAETFHALYLLQFKNIKSRETVQNLFCSLLNVKECQLLCEPPKIRSVPVALFFYKKSLSNVSFTMGPMPEWMARNTLINHQGAAVPESFELCQMVQWALDNNLTEEPEIAFKYAQYAEEDRNASAWLKSNNQAKYVRDCAYMVKMYMRQQMREMSMSDWIWKRCNEIPGEGDWKPIAMLLKYQGITLLSFLTALRFFLKGQPKKNCIVFEGPPDTGKSYLCYSMIKFFKGKVASYMNSRSQFWLQPFIDTKLGFIDDATSQCWSFMDVYMRNALDGNYISVDSKHKAPMQLKLPPLLVTTNVEVMKEPMYKYLHSRLTCFSFPRKLPLKEDGTPVYEITDVAWKCFFRKLYKQLDLTPEDEGDGDTDRALRDCAGGSPETL